MVTGDAKPKVICLSSRKLLPYNCTFSMWQGKTFEECEAAFKKRYPHFIPLKVFWIETRHELWVEMTYEANNLPVANANVIQEKEGEE